MEGREGRLVHVKRHRCYHSMQCSSYCVLISYSRAPYPDRGFSAKRDVALLVLMSAIPSTRSALRQNSINIVVWNEKIHHDVTH